MKIDARNTRNGIGVAVLFGRFTNHAENQIIVCQSLESDRA